MILIDANSPVTCIIIIISCNFWNAQSIASIWRLGIDGGLLLYTGVHLMSIVLFSSLTVNGKFSAINSIIPLN